MAERKCNFDCEYLDDSGECEAVGPECWKRCQNCIGSEKCSELKY